MPPLSKLRAFPNRDICGVGVCRISESEFISYVTSRAFDLTYSKSEISEPPMFITYLNAACSNIAATDTEYNRILAESDIVYADGQAIVWAAQSLGERLPGRVNAGDFIIDFCRVLTERGISIGLVGGRPGVALRAAEVWRQQVPGLRVSGTWSGFFGEDEAEVIARIRRSNARVLLVGMGVPLQEKWAWHHRDELGVKVIWCVGALFEYYGEGRARAPVWMRKAGLEWLFRLVLEPRRLWRRYLIGNWRFLWRVKTYRRRGADKGTPRPGD